MLWSHICVLDIAEVEHPIHMATLLKGSITLLYLKEKEKNTWRSRSHKLASIGCGGRRTPLTHRRWHFSCPSIFSLGGTGTRKREPLWSLPTAPSDGRVRRPLPCVLAPGPRGSVAFGSQDVGNQASCACVSVLWSSFLDKQRISTRAIVSYRSLLRCSSGNHREFAYRSF